MLKDRRDLLDYGTPKSAVSYKWLDESSWLTELFLNADSYWIIFGLTTNLLSIFDIYLMSTAVVLVKNVLLLVPTGKVLELGSPNAFNKSLSVKRLFPF